MFPKTLSATSISGYEECSARWAAEQLLRAGSPGGGAASLGSNCHDALEEFISKGHHLAASPVDVLLEMFHQRNAKWGVTSSQISDGEHMLREWHARQDWTGRTVVEVEVKRNFPLTTSAGVIPVNYIIDRLDQTSGPGEPLVLEVIDYKTSVFNETPDSIRHKFQAQLYALAVRIAYPQVDRVWVKFDMLRHGGLVGTCFTRDDNVKTWKYLKDVAERIIADNDPEERLNSGCRFCVRKAACTKLQSHMQVGGPLGITDPHEAAKQIAFFNHIRGALAAQISEMEDIVFQYCEREEVTEFETPDVSVTITASKRREVDGHMAAQIVGPELATRYGTIGVTAIDKIIKNNEVNDDTAAELVGLIELRVTDPKVNVKPKPVV